MPIRHPCSKIARLRAAARDCRAPGRLISKDAVMVTIRLDCNALVQFLAGGCAVLFGACALVEFAQAQYVPAPIPPPPPVFNPSSPYTVPQPSYRPIAPATPNAAPGNVVSAPVGPPATHRRTTAAKTPRVKTSLAKTRVAERRVAKTHRAYRSRAVAVGPAPVSYSSTYAPFGYGYGCAWRRAWDGHWFRTSPCS
jgi:hypothetical protein